MTLKLENIKTQEDLDKAVEALRTEIAQGITAKLSKREGVIDEQEYNNLKKLYDERGNKIKDLESKNLELEIKPKIQQAFTSQNGNQKAFEDFYALHKDKAIEAFRNEKDKDALKNLILETQKEKPYLFSNEQKGQVQTALNAQPTGQQDKPQTQTNIQTDGVKFGF